MFHQATQQGKSPPFPDWQLPKRRMVPNSCISGCSRINLLMTMQYMTAVVFNGSHMAKGPKSYLENFEAWCLKMRKMYMKWFRSPFN